MHTIWAPCYGPFACCIFLYGQIIIYYYNLLGRCLGGYLLFTLTMIFNIACIFQYCPHLAWSRGRYWVAGAIRPQQLIFMSRDIWRHTQEADWSVNNNGGARTHVFRENGWKFSITKQSGQRTMWRRPHIDGRDCCAAQCRRTRLRQPRMAGGVSEIAWEVRRHLRSPCWLLCSPPSSMKHCVMGHK